MRVNATTQTLLVFEFSAIDLIGASCMSLRND